MAPTIQNGAWTEEAAPDTELVRYILESEGTLIVTDDDTTDQKEQSLQPRTWVTVPGPATLEWASKTKILLTPSYEEGGFLVGVGTRLIVLMAALIAATS